MSLAGLPRCHDRSRPARRAGTCSIGTEPHPPGTAPATSRYQRDDVTSQAARHVRGLVRRDHHTRARTVCRGEHHWAGTGIAYLATHELGTTTFGDNIGAHRHAHGIGGQAHRPRSCVAAARGLRRYARLRCSTVGGIGTARDRTRPRGQAGNGAVTPR